MNTQKVVTTTMENSYDQQIIIRQFSEPTQQVKEIYSTLQYKMQPFTRKKSVVPPWRNLKKIKPAYSLHFLLVSCNVD